MKITSPRLNTSHLTANEEALLRSQTALDLKERGFYEGALNAMGRFWKRLGERPNTEELYPSVKAEVLLTAGILTRWIASKNKLTEYQETARDLICESITLFDLSGDVKKVAESRAELAYCYWWEGALDEARILFNQSLKKLTTEGNTRANALLGLAVVEWSAARYNEALRILTDNSSLFNKLSNHATKGTYHNQLAMVLRMLGTSQDKEECFRRAIREYQEADNQFKLAKSVIFRANVKNNVGYLLYRLGRFKQAHRYVEDARRLASRVKDKVRVAQFDDTRAQIFIAEKRFKNAEATARAAVKVLDKSGHQCLLTDALVTHAIALARLKQWERARFTFQRAIDVAYQVGALNKAGLAALSMIEELEQLPAKAALAAYQNANEWLSKSQSPELLRRVNAAALKIFSRLADEVTIIDAPESVSNLPCHLQTEVLKFESSLIRQALAQSSGSVTRAASLLGMSYQGLAYVIASRHKDLLKERSPIRRRGRKDRNTSEAQESNQQGS